jgi:hypothetical protein
MRRIGIALIFSIMAACSTTQPTLQTGPDAEVTYDGLVRVDNSAMQRAWIKPDIDLSRYDQIMVAPVEFEFRAVRNSGNSRAGQNEFAISESAQQSLINTVTQVFQEELARSRYFTRTDTPGPNVLLIEGALLDIVSRVPPDVVGRGSIYLDRVGEATLVLQLVDSTSGETLARAVDRRAAERASGAVRSSNVTSMAEVRRLARRWATRLREAVDELHEIGPLDQAGGA